jgi:hypothetical protein
MKTPNKQARLDIPRFTSIARNQQDSYSGRVIVGSNVFRTNEE